MRQKNFLTALLVAALVTPSSFAQTGTVPAKKTKATKSSRLTSKASLKTQRGPQARGGTSSSDTILPAGSLAPATSPTSPYGLPVGQVVPAVGSSTTNGLLPSGSRVASVLPVTAQCTPGTAGCSAALPAVQPQQSSSSMAPMMAALAALAGAFGGNKNKNNSNNNNSNTNSNGGGGGSPNYENNGGGNPSPAPEEPPSTTGRQAKADDRNHVLAGGNSDGKTPADGSKPSDGTTPPQPTSGAQKDPSTCEKMNPKDFALDWQKVSGKETLLTKLNDDPCKGRDKTPIPKMFFAQVAFGMVPKMTSYAISSQGRSTPIFAPADGTVESVKMSEVSGNEGFCTADVHDSIAGDKEVQCIVTIAHKNCPDGETNCVSRFRFNATVTADGKPKEGKNSCQFKPGDHIHACQVIATVGKDREKLGAWYSLSGRAGKDLVGGLEDRENSDAIKRFTPTASNGMQ